MHYYISNIISDLAINNIFNNDLTNNKNIFKIQYLLYSRFYFIYLFLYFLKKNQFIDYSLVLHIQYIISLVFNNFYSNNDIKSKYNLIFLDKLADFLFVYLLSIKIYFKNDISNTNKFFINTLSLGYFFIYQINDLYKSRLNSIINKKEFKHYLKILFSHPNINDINNIIENTNIFNLSNFYIFINILLFLLFT